VNVAFQHGGSENESTRASNVVVAHLHGFLVGGAPLVRVFGEQDFVVGIDPSGDLTVENESHQFILEIPDVGVEGRRHFRHIGGKIGREVLGQRAIADGGVEVPHVRGQVDVQQKIIADLGQQTQTGSVFRLVKLVNDFP